MNKILVGLVVLVGGALAGWYFLGPVGLKGKLPSYVPTPPSQTNETPSGVSPTAGTVGGEIPGSVAGGEKGGTNERTVVTYTANGFNPKTVTVKAGTTVVFMNDSSAVMWVASAVHPTHQLLPGFDQLASVGRGGSYEYTFTKVGTWKYHNHVNPSDTGTVEVQ
ncbi:hypothetical protein HYV22_02475 [Candidatus Gottesmanbacteria bacterium]|nr:hypothetical protein [Candidatus Gottesmanbacteria bacterium]